jgi:hypothetical protein
MKEVIEEEETGRASFIISDGKSELKVLALKDCWAIQRWNATIDSAEFLTRAKDNKKIQVPNPEFGKPLGWVSYKYVTDLGSIAGKVFDLRLKNSEVTTLQELSEMAKKIRIDIRSEFGLSDSCACK